jgi:hypothetical protein
MHEAKEVTTQDLISELENLDVAEIDEEALEDVAGGLPSTGPTFNNNCPCGAAD